MGAKKPRVFVSLAVYRDPEGLHTLKDAFDRASDPSRIFAGVHWQHVLAKPSGEEPVVDRLHPAQNMFTRQVEANLGKIQGDEDKVQYLKESMKQQGDNQRELDEKEARWPKGQPRRHRRYEGSGVTSATRESGSAPGSCRARHMSMRLWGGESTCCTRTENQVRPRLGRRSHRRARANPGTDEQPRCRPACPRYHMRMTPVDNPETYERVGRFPCTRDEEREHELSNLVVPLRRDRTDDAPSMRRWACGFGDLLLPGRGPPGGVRHRRR